MSINIPVLVHPRTIHGTIPGGAGPRHAGADAVTRHEMAQFDLSGRVALVTGAGVGIGRAVALALAQAGATVVVHYHTSGPQAEETLDAVRHRGAEGVLLQADLAAEEQS